MIPILASCAVLSLAALGEPFPAHVLVRKGDALGDLGRVTGVGAFDMAHPRQWTATVGLDNPIAPAAVLELGRVLAVWGQPTNVHGVFYRDFGAPQISDYGAVSWPGLVEPILTNLSGLFLDGNVVLLGGDPGSAPGLPPGLTYRFFQAARFLDHGVLVACDLDDPSRPSPSFHQTLMRLTPNAGGPPAQSVLVQLGGLLPGSASPVANLPSDLSDFDTNRPGNIIYLAHTEDGVGHVVLDDTVVIRLGDTVASLGLPLDWALVVNLDDGAGWLLSGWVREASGNLLDVVLVNGAPIAVEGDPLPGVPGFIVLHAYGTELADGGQALWRATWNDPDQARDEGLFLGDQLLVQEGVTLVEGQVVTAIGPATVSDDGRVLLFTAGLGPGAAAYDNLIRLIVR